MGNLTNSHLKVTDNPPGLQTLTSITDTDISDVADALNFLCSALEANKTVRVLLNALIGLLAGRSTVIEFYHFDLGKRMFGSGYLPPAEFKKHREQVEAKVSDAMAQLLDWSAIWRLPIAYTPGHRDETGEKIPSKIKTPLLSWASQIANLAREMQTGESDQARSDAFRQATKEILKAKRITRQPVAATRAKKDRHSGTEYQAAIKFCSRFITKKTEETQKPRAEVINSFIWDLQGKLEQDFAGMDVQNPPLPADLAPGEIPLDEYGQELTPDPQILQVYSVAVDSENPAAVDDQKREHSAPAITPPPVFSSSGLEKTDAQQTIEAFRSVGCTTMKIFDNANGRDNALAVPVKVLEADIDKRIETAEQQGSALFTVRPHQQDDVCFIQIDDPSKNLDELQQAAFLTAETSPGNIQAWLAVDLPESGGHSYQAIRRAAIVYFGADGQASGSMRCPGSLYKKHDPAPVVRLMAVQRRHVLAQADIGHLLPNEQPSARPVPVRPAFSANGKRRPEIPTWQRMSELHPVASDGKPSTPSHIDYYCALAAAENGVRSDEAVQWLLNNSPDIEQRKRHHARAYAETTVQRAYQAVMV